MTFECVGPVGRSRLAGVQRSVGANARITQVSIALVIGAFVGCGGGVEVTAGPSGGGGEATSTGGRSTGSGGATGSGGSARSGGATGSGGTVRTGGATGSGGAGGSTVGTGTTPTMLPVAKEACPTIVSGNLTFLGQPVTIWAGTAKEGQQGPVVIYWYATGSNPQEAVRGLGQAAINEITAQGGLVAAPGATNKKGTNTGNGVWYTGDFETTDEVIACAIAQLHVDTRRIHASGFSAGGLQTTYMAYARSGYVASVVPYSGGLTGFGTPTPQDPTNVPAAMVVHGAMGSDTFILDFASTSATYAADVKKKGGFAMDCNHGGGHMIPSGIPSSTWTFMKAHPFHAVPDPYAGGIPAGFPAYCTIVP